MPDPDLNNPPPRNAIVLLSGGLDSATVLAIALQAGYHVTALSFDYGQRHRFELDAARQIAQANHIKNHLILNLSLDQISPSALTTDHIAVPKNNQSTDDKAPTQIGNHIPVTYVPARNTIFLSCALGLAESSQAFDIFLGVNALDYSGYPDCRPEFIDAFQGLANLATKAGVEAIAAKKPPKFRIQAPLINLTKAQIIRQGTDLGVDYQLTSSCYDPQPKTGHACGTCDACILRRRGFHEANIPDPTQYMQTPA